MIKVSIILPVYNTKEFLEKCLESILNQSLKEIEIIVVNDGSTDDSQTIINEYAKKDNRVKAFYKENGGLSEARNFGMTKATGKYIWFIDSDDYLIKKDACEKFYNLAEEYNLDIAVCNYVSENKKRNSIIKLKSEELINKLYCGKTYLKESYKSGWNLKMVWLNFYKKEFLEKNNLQFEFGRVHEDWLFTPVAFLNAERVMCIKDYFYYYRYNDNSITKSKFKKQNVIDNMYLINKLKKECDNLEDLELKQILHNDIVKQYLYLKFLLKINKKSNNNMKNDKVLENLECSKKIEYRIAIYKKSNTIYFGFYGIYVFLKHFFGGNNKNLYKEN